MIPVIESLARRLDADGVRYCHWKSNWALGASVEGETDLDLLVHHDDIAAFRSALADLGYRPSFDTGLPPLPSTEHHHALDDGGTRHIYDGI